MMINYKIFNNKEIWHEVVEPEDKPIKENSSQDVVELSSEKEEKV